MVKLRKKEKTGNYFRREGRVLKQYKPGDVINVVSTKSMKPIMDGFERVKDLEAEVPLKEVKKFKRKE